MNRLVPFFLGLLFGCNLLSVSLPLLNATESKNFLIVYTGNLLAELKPCGCAKEEDQGGIERRMQYLKDLRKNKPNLLLVDTGDHFKEPTRQGKLKAETLMKATEMMSYDYVALGERDLVYGSQFLKNQSVPFVAGNIVLKNLPLKKSGTKLFKNGLKVATLSVVDPNLFYLKNHAGLKILDPDQFVSQEISKIQESNPDLTVLITHMDRKKAMKFLGKAGVDIVINGHIFDETDTVDMKPFYKNNKVFVQASPRGQKMGEIKVSLDQTGKISFEHRMVRLDSSIKNDPEMVKLYSSYNEKIEAMFFESLSTKRKKDKASVFAGEATCKTCHLVEHKKWSSSRHGRAYETLKKINKAFDPECLVCHVVAYNKLGGFISELDTPGLKNVQCEVCHGPAKKHIAAPTPGFGMKAKSACKICHVKNHSPNFNFNKYWPKIKH